jgi:hypothetical protein
VEKVLISQTNFQTIYCKISTIICTPTLENWNLLVIYVFFLLTKEVLGNPIQLVGAFAWKAGIVLSDVVKYIKK